MKLLMVIDMQKDFIDGSLGTKEAQAIVPKVIRKVQEFEGKVIFTRDTHFQNYLETAEGKKLPVKHCIKETPGWELQEDLEQLRISMGCETFDKITFGSKELVKYLTENIASLGGISAIVLCGLCTDICVISNAILIKAFLPEIPVIVDAACCAGVTPESHDNALKAMQMCHIDVVD